MSAKHVISLRRFEEADLEAAAELSREARWPLWPEDWGKLLASAEGVVAERDGRVVGTALSWRYGERCAALGMALVAKDFQGQGIARRMVSWLLDRLQDHLVVVHTPALYTSLYTGLGFEPQETLSTHQGLASMAPLVALEPGDRVRPLGRDDSMTLRVLDEKASGLARAFAIQELLESGSCVVLENAGTPKGYAFCRESGFGLIIGPVAAPTEDGAKALIAHWVNHAVRQKVRVDVPADTDLSRWLDSIGLREVDRATVLVRGNTCVPAEPPYLWAAMLQTIV